ncbi:hypothetical protein QTN25_010661 [Entamoeba marina]
MLYYILEEEQLWECLQMVSKNCREAIHMVRINPSMTYFRCSFLVKFFVNINTIQGDLSEINKQLTPDQFQSISLFDLSNNIPQDLQLVKMNEKKIIAIRVNPDTISCLDGLTKLRKIIFQDFNTFNPILSRCYRQPVNRIVVRYKGMMSTNTKEQISKFCKVNKDIKFSILFESKNAWVEIPYCITSYDNQLDVCGTDKNLVVQQFLHTNFISLSYNTNILNLSITSVWNKNKDFDLQCFPHLLSFKFSSKNGCNVTFTFPLSLYKCSINVDGGVMTFSNLGLLRNLNQLELIGFYTKVDLECCTNLFDITLITAKGNVKLILPKYSEKQLSEYINDGDNIVTLPYLIGESIKIKGKFNIQQLFLILKKEHRPTIDIDNLKTLKLCLQRKIRFSWIYLNDEHRCIDTSVDHLAYFNYYYLGNIIKQSVKTIIIKTIEKEEVAQAPSTTKKPTKQPTQQTSKPTKQPKKFIGYTNKDIHRSVQNIMNDLDDDYDEDYSIETEEYFSEEMKEYWTEEMKDHYKEESKEECKEKE